MKIFDTWEDLEKFKKNKHNTALMRKYELTRERLMENGMVTIRNRKDELEWGKLEGEALLLQWIIGESEARIKKNIQKKNLTKTI